MSETTAAPATPANWYPDPRDPSGATARWWDGSTWTDQVAPIPQAPAPSTVVTMQPQTPRVPQYAYSQPSPARPAVGVVAALTGVVAAAIAAAQFTHLVPATADMTPWWWAAAAAAVPLVLGIIGIRLAAWSRVGKAAGVVAIVAGLLAGGTGGWMQWDRHQDEQAFVAALTSDDNEELQPVTRSEGLDLGWKFCSLVRQDAAYPDLTAVMLTRAKSGGNFYTSGYIFGSAATNLCPDQKSEMLRYSKRWQASLDNADSAAILGLILGS